MIVLTLISDQVFLVASVRPIKRQFINGSDDGVLSLRLLDYCTSPIFQYSEKNSSLFLLSSERMGRHLLNVVASKSYCQSLAQWSRHFVILRVILYSHTMTVFHKNVYSTSAMQSVIYTPCLKTAHICLFLDNNYQPIRTLNTARYVWFLGMKFQ